ncbi:ionotropic receptor 21a [Venturia canescens]|uniref:ionotropic receptor 21a n=1 Tax=Venturia canescens TaxID=32260 RepID=UPI001C9CF15B|nr:ionotropic receptor 21a [Venturia canescens]
MKLANSQNLRNQRKDKCYNHMVFLDDIYSVDKIMRKETRNKILVVSESTPWAVRDFLKSYASRFYVHLLVVTHTISQRTKEGTYLLYTHKLYTDGSGRSESLLLTSWINNSLTNPETNLFPKKLTDGFWGHRILISAAHMPPFVIRRDPLSGADVTWDGIDVRMVRLMGEVLNFTAEFRDASSTTMSPIAAAKNDVRLGTSAAAIGGIYKNLETVTEFDTSTAHMQDCASFISLASTAVPKYRAVMGPFQSTVWLLLCAVYIIAIIPLSMNSHYSMKSLLTKPSNLESMFWYVFSTFTNSFYVKNPMLNSGLGQNATSILIGIYWVFTIIITSCYTGSIMAFITVPVYPTAMETADQLHRNRYQIATLDHDGWEKWFNYTRLDDPLAIKLLKNLEYVPTVKEGVRNASRAYFWPYAFLGSRILLEYIVQADFAPNWATKRSLMHISSECFVRYEVTMVLPIESIYTETFNKVIIRARQSGLAQKIVRDVEWDVQRSSTGKLLSVSGGVKLQRVSVEERQLALDDTQGIFLILGAGILIGFFVLSIECCFHRVTMRCKAKQVYDDSDISSENLYQRNVDIWVNDHEENTRRRYSSSSV